MAKKKTDFDLVRELAQELPGSEESTIHGAPSLKVRGKLLACPALHQSAEPDSLVVRIDVAERAALLASEPGIYYVTDHYMKYPMVLVRLDAIGADTLKDLLERAWRFANARKKRSRP